MFTRRRVNTRRFALRIKLNIETRLPAFWHPWTPSRCFSLWSANVMRVETPGKLAHILTFCLNCAVPLFSTGSLRELLMMINPLRPDVHDYMCIHFGSSQKLLYRQSNDSVCFHSLRIKYSVFASKISQTEIMWFTCTFKTILCRKEFYSRIDAWGLERLTFDPSRWYKVKWIRGDDGADIYNAKRPKEEQEEDSEFGDVTFNIL